MTLCGLQLKVRQLKYLFSVCVERGVLTEQFSCGDHFSM